MDECFDTPMTEQEQRLVSILEIVQVEKYVLIQQRIIVEVVGTIFIICCEQRASRQCSRVYMLKISAA